MPLSPEITQRIKHAVAQGFDQQLDFTRQLIRFGSVRGAEHAVQDFIFRSEERRVGKECA